MKKAISSIHSVNKDLARYFLILGTIGFGGSISLAHIMQRDLVPRKKCLNQQDFSNGLSLSQLSPGPLAAQLAMYIGFLKAGSIGAFVSGAAFIFPSFMLVLVLTALYVQFGELPVIQSSLKVMSAATLGIIASSSYRLTRAMIKPTPLIVLIYIVTFFITITTKSTSIIVFVTAGIVTMFSRNRDINRYINWQFMPATFVPLFSIITPFPLLHIFLFFLLAGSISFGGGFAILPFLQHGVVDQFTWITQRQFLDTISFAMITPGPVAIAATSIGYLSHGIAGAIVATIGMFFPIYLVVITLTPLFRKHYKNPDLVSFVEGVTTAALASITASVIVLGQSAVTDPKTVLIAFISLGASLVFNIPTILIILGSVILGLQIM